MQHQVDVRRAREKRHARVRARLSGTAGRPRLCVFRSLKHIYVQAVDDDRSATVACASSLELRGATGTTGSVAAAQQVGTLIAQRLKEKGLESIVFDRGGYLYHGRVKAVADAARAAGLKF
ncbi:MAG TPA: 50S ribosomal protein L18 [Candidatus Polarisedimenticolia bacterium]|nr:50S ribosomal protein L18 [Candidatus Polarisedimenticolia bacterium]